MEQFLKNSRAFIAEVKSQNAVWLREAGESAISLVDRRITESGRTAGGTQLGDYTDGVYKKKRQDKGLTTSYVNLAFTNDMWSDVGIINVVTGANIARLTIGASFQENKNKLVYNSVRYNDDILEVSQSEEDKLAKIMDVNLQLTANKYFK